MVQVIPIEDVDDPRIQAFRDVRERDLVGRGQGFIIEGEVVLRTFVRSGRHQLSSVLLAEKRVEKLAGLLDALTTAQVYCAPQSVMDQIVGFPIHRGVLACGRRGPEPAAETLLSTLGP